MGGLEMTFARNHCRELINRRMGGLETRPQKSAGNI